MFVAAPTNIHASRNQVSDVPSYAFKDAGFSLRIFEFGKGEYNLMTAQELFSREVYTRSSS